MYSFYPPPFILLPPPPSLPISPHIPLLTSTSPIPPSPLLLSLSSSPLSPASLLKYSAFTLPVLLQVKLSQSAQRRNRVLLQTLDGIREKSQ